MRLSSVSVWSICSWTLLASSSTAFVPTLSKINVGSTFVTKSGIQSSMKMSEDSHDVVRVDLDDGRDYPIYIGADFDEIEGNSSSLSFKIIKFLSVNKKMYSTKILLF